MRFLVNIDCDDLPKAESFYTEAFGLHVRRRFGTSGVELAGANCAVFLLEKPAGSVASNTTAQVRDYARHWTPVHLDIVVDDLDAAVARVQAAGGILEVPPRTDRWGRIALFADPFGHGLCIIQFLNRGYDEIADAANGA